MSETTANELRDLRKTSAPGRNTKSPPKTAEPVFELLDLGLIDEPARAMRQTMDEVALQELCESISKIGVVEPLVVERNGQRYRVIAGHRRLIACQVLKHSPVPSIVREPGEVDPAAVTIAENYFRENANAVEEAEFLDNLLREQCGGDVDVLAALIRHRREYVEDRILLLRGSTEVVAALREHKISLAVARELNRIKDPERVPLYLDAAIRGGATANVVRTWRAEADQLPALVAAAGGDEHGDPQHHAPAAETQLRCMFCGETEDPHLMLNKWIHRHCDRFLTRILDRSSEPAAEGKE